MHLYLMRNRLSKWLAATLELGRLQEMPGLDGHALAIGKAFRLGDLANAAKNPNSGPAQRRWS